MKRSVILALVLVVAIAVSGVSAALFNNHASVASSASTVYRYITKFECGWQRVEIQPYPVNCPPCLREHAVYVMEDEGNHRLAKVSMDDGIIAYKDFFARVLRCSIDYAKDSGDIYIAAREYEYRVYKISTVGGFGEFV